MHLGIAIRDPTSAIFYFVTNLQCSKNSLLKLLRQKRTYQFKDLRIQCIKSLNLKKKLQCFNVPKDDRPVVTTVSWWDSKGCCSWHSQTLLSEEEKIYLACVVFLPFGYHFFINYTSNNDNKNKEKLAKPQKHRQCKSMWHLSQRLHHHWVLPHQCIN